MKHTILDEDPGQMTGFVNHKGTFETVSRSFIERIQQRRDITEILEEHGFQRERNRIFSPFTMYFDSEYATARVYSEQIRVPYKPVSSDHLLYGPDCLRYCKVVVRLNANPNEQEARALADELSTYCEETWRV